MDVIKIQRKKYLIKESEFDEGAAIDDGLLTT